MKLIDIQMAIETALLVHGNVEVTEIDLSGHVPVICWTGEDNRDLDVRWERDFETGGQDYP